VSVGERVGGTSEVSRGLEFHRASIGVRMPAQPEDGALPRRIAVGRQRAWNSDIVHEIVTIKICAVDRRAGDLLDDICNDVLGSSFRLSRLLARDDIADIMVNGPTDAS